MPLPLTGVSAGSKDCQFLLPLMIGEPNFLSYFPDRCSYTPGDFRAYRLNKSVPVLPAFATAGHHNIDRSEICGMLHTIRNNIKGVI